MRRDMTPPPHPGRFLVTADGERYEGMLHPHTSRWLRLWVRVIPWSWWSVWPLRRWRPVCLWVGEPQRF